MNGIFIMLDNGTIKLTPEALSIKALRDVYERDTSQNKRRAWLELSAVFFMTSMASTNPYRGYETEQKIREITESIFKGEVPLDTNDNLIIGAAKGIRKIDKMSIARDALRTAVIATNKVRDYIITIDLYEKDDKNNYVHDIKKFQEVARNNAGVAKSLIELEREVKAEEEQSGDRLRGGAEDEYNI